MAKFCTNCGKELKDGKCPKCDKETKKVEKEETTTAAAPSVDVEDIKAAGNDCLKATTGVFTRPFDAIKAFVTDNKLIAGIIMIVLAAASAGLSRIAAIKAAEGATSGDRFNLNEIVNIFYSNSSVIAKPNYAKEFFTEAGTQLAIFAFIALFGYLIITKLLKGKATWKQMVNAVAMSLTVILVANLVNSILVFIDAEVVGYIRSYITSFATIISALVLYYSVKEVAEVDKNKLFLAVASMSVAAKAAWDIIDKIFD